MSNAFPAFFKAETSFEKDDADLRFESSPSTQKASGVRFIAARHVRFCFFSAAVTKLELSFLDSFVALQTEGQIRDEFSESSVDQTLLAWDDA